MRPRRVEPGDRFTWRFKTQDYWQAVQATMQIRTVGELMVLHQPWVTSQASQVMGVIEAHGGRASFDEEGLIVVDVVDDRLQRINAELAAVGCRLSGELLHVI